MRGADLAGWLILPSALAAVVCFTVAARRARDRRRALEVVGACLVAVGVVIFAVLGALLNVVADVGQDPRQRTALRAVFWSAMHVLNVTGKVLIVLGAVIALAASLAGGSSVRQRWADLERMARATLADPRRKAFAAFAAVVGGMVGLVWPAAVAEVLVRAAGVGLILVGAIWIFDLVGASAWVSEREQRRAGAPRHAPPPRARRDDRGGDASPSCSSSAACRSCRAVRAPHLDRMSIRDSGCNGFASLCDRRLDQVTFAGTHNAMSAGDDDFLFARQTGGIGRSARPGRPRLPARPPLRRSRPGRRAHLLPRPPPTRRSPSRRELAPVAKMNPEQRQAVDRAFALAGAELEHEGPQGLPVPSVLRARRHLGAGRVRQPPRLPPGQPQRGRDPRARGPRRQPKDAVAVLEASHLADRAYTWVPGTPPPTLREMIKKKKNVLIMAEHHGGVRPWYQAAYGRILQDTPYKFASLAELEAPASCALGRGQATAPLLLVNHWLDTGLPNPNDARQGQRASMSSTARVDACERQRKRQPTILAVDFYSRGDLIKEVDRLNGVEVPGSVLATAGP